jgi:hypothetical protein
MKVFISWSGERSRQLGEALRDWLPAVVQAVKPYFSPDDVAKGTRWSSEIGVELQTSSFGILCLTPDNTLAPWIVFEAGALSKSLDKAKVCPLLFGLEPTDVTGPLSQFQSAKFEKVEVERLVKAMNKELGEAALGPAVLSQVLDMWWPRLETRVREIESQTQAVPTRGRDVRDMMEEVLALSRGISASVGRDRARGSAFSPMSVRDLLATWRLTVESGLSSGDERTLVALAKLRRPLSHIVRRSAGEPAWEQFLSASRELRRYYPSAEMVRRRILNEAEVAERESEQVLAEVAELIKPR